MRQRRRLHVAGVAVVVMRRKVARFSGAKGDVLVKIRLKRMGAKKRPFYRLVVADSRSPRAGRFIEEGGTYDPIANPAQVQIDADRVRDCISKGARPTDITRQLRDHQGVL